MTPQIAHSRSRRRGGLATAALALVLAASGCGAGAPSTAAVVDGVVITEDQVSAAVEEFNATGRFQEPITSAMVLTSLVRFAAMKDELAAKGVVTSDESARSTLREMGISEPSVGAVDLAKGDLGISAALSQGALTESDLLAAVQSATIDVNPRYGSLDPTTAALTQATPRWIGSRQ